VIVGNVYNKPDYNGDQYDTFAYVFREGRMWNLNELIPPRPSRCSSRSESTTRDGSSARTVKWATARARLFVDATLALAALRVGCTDFARQPSRREVDKTEVIVWYYSEGVRERADIRAAEGSSA